VHGPPNRGPPTSGEWEACRPENPVGHSPCGKNLPRRMAIFAAGLARRDSGPVFFRSAKNLPTRAKTGCKRLPNTAQPRAISRRGAIIA